MVISDKGVQESTTEEGVQPAVREKQREGHRGSKAIKQARTGVFGEGEL